MSVERKCKGLHKDKAQCFRTLGPMPSIPVDLLGSRELGTSSTSASDMDIETKYLSTEESILLISLGRSKWLVVKTE